MTTGALFELIVVLHLRRVLEEGRHPAADPGFPLATLVAAVLCVWACGVYRRLNRA